MMLKGIKRIFLELSQKGRMVEFGYILAHTES